MTNIEIIFRAWNVHKGKGNWKSHRKNRRGEIAPEIKRAVNLRLRDYDFEEIIEAIDNYAMVLLSDDYIWTYAWPLHQFLSRHHKIHRDELQLLRWLPDNFDADDYKPKQERKLLSIQDQNLDDNIRAIEEL